MEVRVARELASNGLFDAAGTPPRISVPAPMVRENAGLAYGWLYIRARNLWAPIVAHAVTNGALGAYVVTTGHWSFW